MLIWHNISKWKYERTYKGWVALREVTSRDLKSVNWSLPITRRAVAEPI